MSHFSRIKTSFRHREALVRCLQELGYGVETDATIPGYHGRHTVDIATKRNGKHGPGFVLNPDGSYDMVADWWGVKGQGEKRLAEELHRQAAAIQQEYAKKMVLEQAAAGGFELVSQTDEEDGSIRILVRRWK